MVAYALGAVRVAQSSSSSQQIGKHGLRIVGVIESGWIGDAGGTRCAGR